VPSVNEAQRRLACIALSIKLKKTPKVYSAEAAKMAQTMSLQQLKDFCRSVKKG